MLRHNLIISYRILKKDRIFSFLNIGGLAIGMTVAIFIGLWVHDEYSFNTNHENYDAIVQVLRTDLRKGEIVVNSSHVSMLGPTLLESYPHLFKDIAMTYFRSREQLLITDENTFEEMGYTISPSAPHILSLPIKYGVQEGLKDRKGIMLSASLATKIFGGENVIGKEINLNTYHDLVVTGVYEDLPENSTFSNANFFISMDLDYNESRPYTWDNFNMKVYGQLQPGVNINEANQVIRDVLKSHMDREENNVFLLPMKDWHLRSHFVNGVNVTSQRLEFIYLFGAIGVFVLILAFINFVNLNTARYQNRLKEVGIKKSIGVRRKHLINQFLSESFLYAFAAFLLTLILISLFLPQFNLLTAKEIVIPYSSISFWIICLAFTFLTALIAGSYPSFYLSSFKPVEAINSSTSAGKGRLRRVLVVFQFFVSILLLVGTITVYQQIQHAKNRSVGYDQERLITIKGRSREFYQKFDLLRAELKNTGVVEEVAEANYPLMNTLGNNDGFRIKGSESELPVSFNAIYVTPEYGQTTQWELIEGRDFNRDLDEKNSIIISKYAAEKMGLENPVGTEIEAKWPYNDQTNFTVIGVVNDMLKGSPFEPVSPLMLFATKESNTFLFIRISPHVEISEALNTIESKFKEVIPTNPFNYRFVDDEYLTKFRSEEQIGQMALFFSVVAILISCLGLFGLSAFVAEKRSKEIGIRKILGASVLNLWKMLSRDFGILIVISSIFALPVAWYFMEKWLAGYSYRIEMNFWTFFLGVMVCLIVSMLTISYHTLKASWLNPTETLRSE